MTSPLLRIGVAALSATISFQAFANDSSDAMDKGISLNPPAVVHGFFVRARGDIEFPISSEFHGGASTTIHPRISGGQGGRGRAHVNIDSKDFDDIYGTMYGGGIELGFAINDRLDALAGLSYLGSNAKTVTIGDIDGRDFVAKFDDYKSWRLHGGVRYELAPDEKLRPYTGAFVGVNVVDRINGDFRLPGTGFNLRNVPFYDDSSVIFTGATLGVAYDVSPNFEIGVESGFTYSGKLKEDDGTVSGLGVPGINNKSSLFTIPVRIFGSLDF